MFWDKKHKAEEELLEQMAKAYKDRGYAVFSSDTTADELLGEFLPAEETERKRLILYFASRLEQLHKADPNKTDARGRYYQEVTVLLLRATIPQWPAYSDDELLLLIGSWYETLKEDYFWYQYPAHKMADHLLTRVAASGMTEPLRKSLKMVRYPDGMRSIKESRQMNDRIDIALQGGETLPINGNDPLGAAFIASIEKITDTQAKQKWKELIDHCIATGDKSSPAKKWLADARPLVDRLDKTQFTACMLDWLATAKKTIAGAHKTNDPYRSTGKNVLSENVQDIFKALIWCTAFVNDPGLNNALDDYAAMAYRKKPGVGPLSAKTGTACMVAFSQLPVKEGISKLVKFRSKIKNNTILKAIDKIIRDVSEKNNVSRDELEELSIPDFGLDSQGILRVPMGDYSAVYSAQEAGDAALAWEKDGKMQKAVPTSVKESYSAQLKALKNTIKELESLLPVYKEKLEQSFLKGRTWTHEQWTRNYLHHPLMSTLAKRLIWHFSDDHIKTQGIWLDNAIVDVNGNPIHPGAETQVRLWHPIGFSTGEIVGWRNFLQTHRITQPLKQAYREIYVVTDAELTTETYSNRFAAHILRQHQFAALCKQRGWAYRLMGNFDSHNTPTILLDNWNIRAQFFVDSDWNGEAGASGIFSYIATDQVRFYKGADLLRMDDVPALVFTEMMRDIDLFVGVSSIGNDPAWQDGGDTRANTYWHDYSFSDLSESAKIRSEILKGLVPRLKIAGKCSFDGKYLRVQGKLRTYKIHMGSGNILMEPDDRYLCIVPERSAHSTEKLFLPFEGDTLLSIILSKAMLLAGDDKITDPTIVRQIDA